MSLSALGRRPALRAALGVAGVAGVAAMIAAIGVIGAPAPAPAQVAPPTLDSPNAPFSFPSHPTDEIGVMDGRGTMVTPEGYLYTGYGELVLFAGPRLTPVNQRVKTLLEDDLPVVQYGFTRAGIDYRVTTFAATLDGNPESPLVNFVRLEATNPGSSPAMAFWRVAVRYQAPSTLPGGEGNNRFFRPYSAKHLGGYDQPGVAFDTAWTYGFAGDAMLRGGRVMYLFPTDPAPIRRLTIGWENDSSTGDMALRKLRPQPTEPVGAVDWRLPLAPHATASLVVKMPYAPVAPDDSLVAAMRAASFDGRLQRTEGFWHEVFARAADFDVAEPKVRDTWRSSLVYDLLARDKHGDDFVQTVNEFHYHAFWLRDASFIVRAYDVAGLPHVAAQTLDFFARWQQPDGNFVSQGGQFDGWGQTLWAYGQHYRLTGDRAFAARVFPSVMHAVDWEERVTAADSLHLLPPTSPGDNEDIRGRITGHDFLALDGLANAIVLADALGRRDQSARFRRDYDALKSALLARLHVVTAPRGGYIPPGLDVAGGQDWGNMLGVYPERILDPHDPMVTATLDSTRAKYAEGIMTYGDGRWLHLYLTMKNTETEVVRGDQRQALEELYAMLAHTTSTNAGWEFDVTPWGSRDFGQNLSPHGWFAAEYVALLRNMLVREAGDTLHLLSVVSPEWAQPGDSIVVRRAPTAFGPVAFRADASADGLRLALAPDFRARPRAIVVHVPFFVDATRATADGRAVPVVDGAVRVPSGTRVVTIAWRRRSDAPAPSYARAVEALKAGYRRAWDSWTGRIR